VIEAERQALLAVSLPGDVGKPAPAQTLLSQSPNPGRASDLTTTYFALTVDEAYLAVTCVDSSLLEEKKAAVNIPPNTNFWQQRLTVGPELISDQLLA
jgi:hypothetical protein